MGIRLSKKEEGMLEGRYGDGARLAMAIIVRMAEVMGASELMSISQAHIDGCGLMCDSGLEFAETLSRLGARVSVPTTLNMIPLDLQNWREQGVPDAFGARATAMARAYLSMGCIPTWTCAPYQGYLAPRYGQQVAWGESNAIAYANSVLGARTNRYADYMDICAAITGRVPKCGLHIKENRKGQILFRLAGIDPALFVEDTFYPVLGNLVGKIAQDRIPVIEGLDAQMSSDQFKAFGAAAASAGAVGLFHIVGQTPEAVTLEEAFQGEAPAQVEVVTPAALLESLGNLSSGVKDGTRLDAVILGCPHFSYAEFRQLAELIRSCGHKSHPDVQMIVLTNQTSYGLLKRGGFEDIINDFGARIVLDTCVFHCPIVSPKAATVMSNSGKCCYYAPGELGVNVAFGSMEDCVRSAVEGNVRRGRGPWRRG
ncbi:MAG: aconitase X [Ignavibacteriales bacterium]